MIHLFSIISDDVRPPIRKRKQSSWWVILYTFLSCCYFNPRTYGSARAYFPASCNRVSFHSTHPRGVQPWQDNSHCPCFPISIHAPARGATANIHNSRIINFSCPKAASVIKDGHGISSFIQFFLPEGGFCNQGRAWNFFIHSIFPARRRLL